MLSFKHIPEPTHLKSLILWTPGKEKHMLKVKHVLGVFAN